METLRKDGRIETTRIYVLNPDYVKDKTKKNKAVARACWLGVFGNDSGFDASGRDVDDSYLWLRGVRSEDVAEGDAQKSEEDIFKKAYQTLLDDPFQAAGRMDKKILEGLLGIIQSYIKHQKN